MAVTANQHVAVHSVEDVMLTVRVIITIIYRLKAETDKLIMNFLFGGQAGIGNVRLNQHSTYMAVAILCESDHAICAIRKVLIVCFDTLKKRSEIVIRITEVVQLDNLRAVFR